MLTAVSLPVLPKRLIFGSTITTATAAQVQEAIFKAAEAKQGHYICFANVHMLMEADTDPAFQQILNRAYLALPDGAPVAMYLRRRYRIAQERQPGMDWFPRLLQEAANRGVSVFFYGGQPAVLEILVHRAKENLPTLRIAGAVSPPYRALTPQEDAAYMAQINASGAGLVFVALGCPKQEKWMAAHQQAIHACMLGVGQAFLTYAGLEKRLPPALRKLPIEWLYRLILEPRRLFRRYALTNTRFLLKVASGK